MASQRKSSSLAATASDRIRAIIDAAEQTAAQIRSEAEQEAERIRRAAEEEASGIRSEARGDVQELLESLRERMSQLSADLELLTERLRPARPAAAAAPTKPLPPPAPVTVTDPQPADADIESARLVALNMALDGTSRADVERYLSENFSLPDLKALLDDVYASISG